jgi:hypothetical protein
MNKNVKNRIRLSIEGLEKSHSHLILAKQLSNNYYILCDLQSQIDLISGVITELKNLMIRKNEDNN